MIYEFELGINTTKARKRIYCAKLGCKNRDNQAGSGRFVDSDAVLKVNPTSSTRIASDDFGISLSRVAHHLYDFGKSSE